MSQESFPPCKCTLWIPFIYSSWTDNTLNFLSNKTLTSVTPVSWTLPQMSLVEIFLFWQRLRRIIVAYYHSFLTPQFAVWHCQIRWLISLRTESFLHLCISYTLKQIRKFSRRSCCWWLQFSVATREYFPCLCILTPGHIIKNQVPTIIYYSTVSKSVSLFSHSYFAKLYYLNKRVDPVVQAII